MSVIRFNSPYSQLPSLYQQSKAKQWSSTCVTESVLQSVFEESSVSTRRGSGKYAGPCPIAYSLSKPIPQLAISRNSECLTFELTSSFLRPSYLQLSRFSHSCSNLSSLCKKYIGVTLIMASIYPSELGPKSHKNNANLNQTRVQKINNPNPSTVYGFSPLSTSNPELHRIISANSLLGAAGFGENTRSRPSCELFHVSESARCAIGKAFSSMVFMIKTLQSYAIQMRSFLLCEDDIHNLLNIVHREIHLSFLWLFQQIFAKTPTLMISIMLLFADFTVHSLGQNITPIEHAIFDNLSPIVSIKHDFFPPSSYLHPDSLSSRSPQLKASDFFTPLEQSDGFGGNGRRSNSVGGAYENDGSNPTSWNQRGLFHPPDWSVANGTTSNTSGSVHAKVNSFPVADFSEVVDTERSALLALLERTAKEMELKDGQPVSHLQLDQETIRLLVAPVRAKIEPDDYVCFDRTDLQYQHALSMDPENPMLLSNYAQFLYVVRHDFNAAEQMFHRAMAAGPTEGDILGRFASFLWLARGDRAAADRAYRAAIASDPSNPYYSGSYAHFLWHAGDEDSCPMPGEA